MGIVITGASGFVGKNLKQYLANHKYVVHPLSLRNEDWKMPDSDVDAIVHLAGKAHDTMNTDSSEEYFKINFELTKRLFDAFLQSGVRDFFYFSSVKAVADTVSDILHETDLPVPKTPYGQSKLCAEQYIQAQELPADKRVFIVRPCMIHGPGNKGNLNLLYQVVKSGIPWPLASFSNSRSFLSIENLNYLILAILRNSSIPSGVYNFADDKALSTNDVVRIIAEGLGRKPRLWRLPSNMIFRLARIGDRFSRFPLNSERLKKLVESYTVSNAKIKAVLNIDQLPVSSADGLKQTIASFRDL